MTEMTRRAGLAMLATGGGLVGLGYTLHTVVDMPVSRAGREFGSVNSMDMGKYINMFMRHTELRRDVEVSVRLSSPTS